RSGAEVVIALSAWTSCRYEHLFFSILVITCLIVLVLKTIDINLFLGYRIWSFKYLYKGYHRFEYIDTIYVHPIGFVKTFIRIFFSKTYYTIVTSSTTL